MHLNDYIGFTGANNLSTDDYIEWKYRGFFVEHYRKEYNRTHKNKISQERLADVAGISLSTYKRFVNYPKKNQIIKSKHAGKNQIIKTKPVGFTCEQMEKIRETLNLSISAFAEFEVKREISEKKFFIDENYMLSYIRMKNFFSYINYLNTDYYYIEDASNNDNPDKLLFDQRCNRNLWIKYYFRYNTKKYSFHSEFDYIREFDNIEQPPQRINLFNPDGSLNTTYLNIFNYDRHGHKCDWQEIVLQKFHFTFDDESGKEHEIDPALLLHLYTDKSISATDKMKIIANSTED